MALTKLLASMKDDRGNVVIKNFYDDVVPLTASERRAIDEIPNVDQKLLEQFGLAQSGASRQPHRAAAQPPDAEHRRP